MKTLKLNKATMAKLASEDMQNIYGGKMKEVVVLSPEGVTITYGCDSIRTQLTKDSDCC